MGLYVTVSRCGCLPMSALARVDRHVAGADQYVVRVDQHVAKADQHVRGMDQHMAEADQHVVEVDPQLRKRVRWPLPTVVGCGTALVDGPSHTTSMQRSSLAHPCHSNVCLGAVSGWFDGCTPCGRGVLCGSCAVRGP